MKKITIEIIISAAIVLIPTFFIYRQLAPIDPFWNTQTFWSSALIICWIIVSAGYYHQGWLVSKGHHARSVSVFLPTAVFFVQCILFVKGIYYHDWSLIIGALIVNSGVLFSLYHIIRSRKSIGN